MCSGSAPPASARRTPVRHSTIATASATSSDTTAAPTATLAATGYSRPLAVSTA